MCRPPAHSPWAPGFSAPAYCPIFPFSHLAISVTGMLVLIDLVSDKPLELVYIGHWVWRVVQREERGKSRRLLFPFCIELLSLSSLSVNKRICMKCTCLDMFVNHMAVAGL